MLPPTTAKRTDAPREETSHTNSAIPAPSKRMEARGSEGIALTLRGEVTRLTRWATCSSTQTYRFEKPTKLPSFVAPLDGVAPSLITPYVVKGSFPEIRETRT